MISICSPIVLPDAISVTSPITNPSCAMRPFTFSAYAVKPCGPRYSDSRRAMALSLSPLFGVTNAFFLSSLASVARGPTAVERVGRREVVAVPRKEDEVRLAMPAEGTKAVLRVFIVGGRVGCM